MKISVERRRRLTDLLTDDLRSLKVEGFLIAKEDLKQSAKWDECLRGTETLTALSQMIDDNPIREFVQNYIVSAMFDSPTLLRRSDSVLLSSIKEFKDVRAVAEQIVDRLLLLPYQYHCLTILNAELTTLLPANKSRLHVGPHMELARIDASFAAAYETPRPKNLLALGSSPALKTGSIALRFSTSGYIARFGQSHTVAEVLSAIKSFYGAGMALNLFSEGSLFQTSILYQLGGTLLEELSTRTLACFEVTSQPREQKKVYVGSRDFESDAADLMKRLRISDSLSNTPIACAAILERIAICMSDPSNKIQLASRYYFDSLSMRDEVQSYVQAMIAFEVLLGEKPKGSSSEESPTLMSTLRNRCAYMIAKSRSERDAIVKKFAQMYSVRSSIVHNGKVRLTSGERELLFELRGYCARVISHEAKLLAADS